jgi:hypothetical protein
MTAGVHIPVQLERTLELLAPALDRPHAVHVDATVGLGGHAEAVLAAHPDLTLVGLDRDPQALAHSRQRLAPYAERVKLEHAIYDELSEVLERLAMDTVDSVLFDLGVSSLQLDEAGRGFAYAQDAPLDMRMDQTTGITAAEVVNTYPAQALTRVLRVYGEEKFASRIAAAIVRERDQGATELLGPPGRPGAGLDPGGRPADRRSSGQADVPGVADRGQRRTGRPRRRPAGGDRRAVHGGTDRRAVLPLAGGPHRQAGLRRPGPGPAPRSTCRSYRRAAARPCACSRGAPSFQPRPRFRPTHAPLR